MNPLLFVAKLTTVLVIGAVSVLLLRRADAALRHCVCAVALECALLFAFMGSIAPAPSPPSLSSSLIPSLPQAIITRLHFVGCSGAGRWAPPPSGSGYSWDSYGSTG